MQNDLILMFCKFKKSWTPRLDSFEVSNTKPSKLISLKNLVMLLKLSSDTISNSFAAFINSKSITGSNKITFNLKSSFTYFKLITLFKLTLTFERSSYQKP